MKSNKKGALSVILIVLVVAVLAFLGYAYYKGNQKNPNAGITEKLTSGLADTIKNVTPEVKKTKELNYKFNLNASFVDKKDNKEIASGELKIKDGQIITLDNSLKQRLNIKEISGKIKDSKTGSGKIEEFSLKDVDFIGDNQFAYYYVGEGVDKILKEISSSIENSNNKFLTIKTISKAKEILNQEKYIKIDNSKPILRVLGKLSESKLIKNIAIGLATSNPNAYFKKNGVIEDLKKIFVSDKLITYLFTKGSYNEEAKQTFLNLNPKICEDFSPVVVNLVKEFDEKNDNLKEEDLKKQCKDSITQLNSALTLAARIYAKGDFDSGNFNFIISVGNIVKLEKEYKNHLLQNWNIDIHIPGEVFDLAVSGDKSGIKSSLVKVNIDENGIKISGEIKDGNGKINISGDIAGESTIKGNIAFKDYKISYDIKANTIDNKSNLIAKGDYKQGKIVVTRQEKEIMLLEYSPENFVWKADTPESKFNMVYKNKVFDLDLQGKNELKGKAHYEKGKFSFSSHIKEYNGIIESNFNYDNGKVSGNLKNNDIDATLTGDFRSFGDFDLEFNEQKEKINVVVKAQKISENENKCNLVVKKDNKEELSLNINRIAGEKNGFKTCNLKGEYKTAKNKRSGEFNINTEYKQGEAEYKIPKNFEELDIKLQEISPLPDFNIGARSNEMGIGADKIVIGGVTIAGVLGTIAFINLQGYTQEAKNTKILSDLRMITTKVAVALTKGDINLNDLVLDGNKINFEKLGLNEEDFKSPYGDDYLIFIKDDKFEVFGFYIENGKKIAIIKGTYYPENEGDPESLVKINGKIIKNREIIE